ncbi:MAG: zinc ribbon domain-containing protein [Humidesulfovibrio sp.]|nr:zinc ribbon domain-containing protein [Humidesulfovibrio sp.]
MITCTGCGTRNPDAARNCQTCGRKLQSRWAAQGGDGQEPDGGTRRNGAGPAPRAPYDLDSMGGDLDLDAPLEQTGAGDGSGWQPLAPAQITADPLASRMMRACAETWTYALLLIAGAIITGVAEDWRYLAGAIVLTAGLAWARGI